MTLVDIEAMDAALDDAIKAEGPFIIITKRPCVLIKEVAKPMQESTARLTRRNAKVQGVSEIGLSCSSKY